jgi:1,4-dihydroxy-2-naphthoate octaprenyltransferase
MLLQVGVNYANDYSDFKKGADTPARIGPQRLAASGLVPARKVALAAIIAFALASMLGFWIALVTDWRLLLLGGLGLAAAWLYTGGPRPYGYSGLGEVAVFVFFGLAATAGTTYVLELRVTPLALLASITPGCLAAAVLAFNNLRDLVTDRETGKRTLAVRIGPEPTVWMIRGLLVIAFAAPFLSLATGVSPWVPLLVLLGIPFAIGPWRKVRLTGAPALVSALKATGRLEAVLALLWTFGLVLHR